MADDRKKPAAQSNAMMPSLQGTIPKPPDLLQNQIDPNLTMTNFPSLPRVGNNLQMQAIAGQNLMQILAQGTHAPSRPAYFQDPNLQSVQSNHLQPTLHRYNSSTSIQPITETTGTTGTTTDTSSERNDPSNRVRKRRHSPSPP